MENDKRNVPPETERLFKPVERPPDPPIPLWLLIIVYFIPILAIFLLGCKSF